MLGRLGMSIDECIAEYLTLSEKVFKQKHMFKVRIDGKIQARFDTDELEKQIKRIVAASRTIQAEGTGASTRIRAPALTSNRIDCKT